MGIEHNSSALPEQCSTPKSKQSMTKANRGIMLHLKLFSTPKLFMASYIQSYQPRKNYKTIFFFYYKNLYPLTSLGWIYIPDVVTLYLPMIKLSNSFKNSFKLPIEDVVLSQFCYFFVNKQLYQQLIYNLINKNMI